MDRVVTIEHLAIGLRRPIQVDTEWLGVTKRNRVLVKLEFREVVLHVIGSKVVVRDGVSEVAIVVSLMLSTAMVRHEQEQVSFSFV